MREGKDFLESQVGVDFMRFLRFALNRCFQGLFCFVWFGLKDGKRSKHFGFKTFSSQWKHSQNWMQWNLQGILDFNSITTCSFSRWPMSFVAWFICFGTNNGMLIQCFSFRTHCHDKRVENLPRITSSSEFYEIFEICLPTPLVHYLCVPCLVPFVSTQVVLE